MIFRNCSRILNIMGGASMILSYPIFGQCLETSYKLYREEIPNYPKITAIMLIPFVLNFGGFYMFRVTA
jgi:hypothetical protein